MPILDRGDAELHYDVRGEGSPPVVLTLGYLASAATYPELIELIADFTTVVTYDLRRTGRSAGEGEVTEEKDVADLLALAEAVGAPVVVVGIGDGGPRAALAGAAAPDIFDKVVATNPLGRIGVEGTSGLAASTSVGELFREQLRTDYRAALRSAIGGVNPQYSEDELRARVDACAAFTPQEVTLARFDYWVAMETLEQCRALGSKLYEFATPGNPFFPPEAAERTRELCPEAVVEILEDGPISRPDLLAARLESMIAG